MAQEEAVPAQGDYAAQLNNIFICVNVLTFIQLFLTFSGLIFLLTKIRT